MNERKQKKCTLRHEWIQWWQATIRVTPDQGQIIQGTDVRAIYRINRPEKTVTLVHGKPSQPILDQRCIEACGYKYEVVLDPTAATIVGIQARDPRTSIVMRLASNINIFLKGTGDPPEP